MRYECDLSVQSQCDVLVCGGGPAGIAAAVTAARQGLSVTLLERYGVVGGCLTVGNVTTIMGKATPGGIQEEIMRLLGAPDGGTAIDPETAKGRLAALLQANGVTLRLQTPVMDAIVSQGSIAGVAAVTQQGPAAFLAQRVIDATGDGYVAARAGAPVMEGREGDGLVQPVSLMYHIEGVDPACAIACRHEEDFYTLPDGREYLSLCAQAAKAGRLPPHVTIVRLYPCHRPGEYLVNATQLGGVHVTRPGDVERAETDLRAQIERVNDFLRGEIPGFAHIHTRVSACTLGVRESRRIRGGYVLTGEDVVQGRRFEDAVVHRANFPIDIHNPTGGGQAETQGVPHQAQDYDIPLRCLQPMGVEHLVLCGRNISGSHRAHASYRVMGIAMSIGQAAGMLAAASLAADCAIRDVPAQSVQKLLKEAGCALNTPIL